MTLNSLVIRAAAIGIVGLGGALYAAQAGWLDALGPAQADTAFPTHATLTSGSGPASPVAPALPEIQQSAEVRLPDLVVTVSPVAPQELLVPTGFEDPAPGIDPDASPDFATSPLGLPCEISVTATAMPAAIAALDVMAPCRPEADLTIRHSGLNITGRTDALGLLTLDIPAFETPAFFSVEFADGVQETALVDLPDLNDFDRVGLVWQGVDGLDLHAMENGAGFGEAGHVWRETPSTAEMALGGSGGFLSIFEAGESHAQIYSFPRATLGDGGRVQLSIDAHVTASNCTRDVSARTLRAEAGGPVETTDLTFTVPGCDAVGDVLILQNLLEDLRLASN